MGAGFSNPMDDAKQERMQTIIKEFLEVFASVFPNSYKDALIESVKEGKQPEEEDERKLPDVPTPEDPLKEGSVTKECAFRKNFKVNHLVAMNKADNFRIDYFDKEGGSLKGSINCAGYKTKKVEGDEHGMEVIPSDDSRRTYRLRFESDEERDEWLDVINNACKKATAPENPDKLLAKAFNGAYRAVRWHYGKKINTLLLSLCTFFIVHMFTHCMECIFCSHLRLLCAALLYYMNMNM